MKKKYFRRAAMIVGVALMAQAATPLAFAASPAMTISATGTTPHSALGISGSGFMPGETILLMFGLNQATTTADSTGAFAEAPLAVPNLPTGNYVALAIGQSSGATAFSFFYISSFYPVASPSTWWTAPGTAITFSGSGFAPNEEIDISAPDSPTPATFNADASGAFAGAGRYVIPYSARNSTVEFTVEGGSSDVSIPLKVGVGDLYPWANTSSWYILPGNTVTFSGGGFGAGEGISITYESTSGLLAHATADSSGNFTSTTSVTIPYGTGAALFHATGDESGAVVDIPITRASFYPTLSPSAYYSAPGGTISLNGSGFVPNETVNITLGLPAPAGTASTSAVADSTGAFSLPAVQLPAVGGVQIPITGVGATSGATATFQMTMGQYYTWITLDPYWAPGGSPLTITGHNFAPNEAVALSTSGGGFGSTTANASGDFDAVTTVPYAPSGPSTITATGAMSSAPATADMTVAPVWTNIQLGSYAGSPGSSIQFIGSGYVPNDLVEVTTDRTDSTPIATIHADAAGSFTDSSFMVPADWVEGNLELTIKGTKSFDTKTITYYVTGS